MSCSTLALCGLLGLGLEVTLPATSQAQGFRTSEQFGTLSYGPSHTSINPPEFVWRDETFPEGLVLPRRESGGSIELSGGAMVTNRLAIMGGFDLHTGSKEIRLANFQFHGGLRNWLTKKLWVEGGLGPTYLDVFEDEGEQQRDSGKWGLGLIGVVGYDLLQRRNASFMSGQHFAAHVQVRMSTNAAGGVRTNTLGLLLGFAMGR